MKRKKEGARERERERVRTSKASTILTICSCEITKCGKELNRQVRIKYLCVNIDDPDGDTPSYAYKSISMYGEHTQSLAHIHNIKTLDLVGFLLKIDV